MVATDVDSDLFDEGAPDNNDGNAIANFTYRITALYSGRDSVLGASAGLKHFGMRRLGRSGLPNHPPLADASSPTDNVWDVDCSARCSRSLTFLNYWLRRFCSSENHPHTGENETRADKRP